MRKAVALVAILVGGLAGCAAPTNSVIVRCLPLKTWPPADQDALRKEYDALGTSAQMRIAFMDYIAMRDADRACLATGR